MEIGSIEKSLEVINSKIIMTHSNKSIDVIYLVFLYKKCLTLIKMGRIELAFFWYQRAEDLKYKLGESIVNKFYMEDISNQLNKILNSYK